MGGDALLEEVGAGAEYYSVEALHPYSIPAFPQQNILTNLPYFKWPEFLIGNSAQVEADHAAEPYEPVSEEGQSMVILICHRWQISVQVVLDGKPGVQRDDLRPGPAVVLVQKLSSETPHAVLFLGFSSPKFEALVDYSQGSNAQSPSTGDCPSDSRLHK